MKHEVRRINKGRRPLAHLPGTIIRDPTICGMSITIDSKTWVYFPKVVFEERTPEEWKELAFALAELEK